MGKSSGIPVIAARFGRVGLGVGGILLFSLLVGCGGTGPVASVEPAPMEMATSYSARKAGDALLVWSRGERIVEVYQNGYHPDSSDSRHTLADGSVLFWGLQVLAAADDGLLTLDEPVSETIHEWNGDTTKSKITLSQLLHGTSGLETSVRKVQGAREALEKPLIHAPGNEFRYGSTAYHVFAEVMNRKAGLDYLKTRILRPLGIEGGYWSYLGKTLYAAYGSHLTAREWGRIGQVILQDGVWDGQTIVQNLRSRLTQPTEASPGFGLGVWLNVRVEADHPFYDNLPTHYDRFPFVLTVDGTEGFLYADGPSDLFMAAGGSGQRLYVVPSRELVVVRFGRADPTWNDAEFLARLLHGTTYSIVEDP